MNIDEFPTIALVAMFEAVRDLAAGWRDTAAALPADHDDRADFDRLAADSAGAEADLREALRARGLDFT